MRYVGTQRDLIVELGKQFSRKVFKIPDVFFQRFNEQYNDISLNEFSKCCAELTELDGRSYHIPCLNLKGQILFSPQGMFQGVLGNMSSLYARDVLTYSDLMHKYILEIDVQSYDTSDDYVRFLKFKDPEGLYRQVSESLWLHNIISNNCGIIRNMYKSNFTKYMCEFNSVFRTDNGKFNPDIKSRLSYIDLSVDYDWSSTSIRCMNVSVEYLRNEGSVLGSIWVQIINTHLSLLSTGRLPFFRSSPLTCFRIPLEIGGIVRIDPVRNSLETMVSVLKQNYDMNGRLDLYGSFKVMLASTSRNAEDDIDMGESKTKNVASMSRSGIACLMSRYPRAKRAIEEYLLSIAEEDFLPMAFGGFKRNPIAVLMSSAQRESSVSDHNSSATRFMVPQTPADSDVYRINSQFMSILYGQMGSFRVSRRFITTFLVKRYREATITANDNIVVNGIELECPDIRLDIESVEQHVKTADEIINSISPKGQTFKIMSVNKHMFSHRYIQQYFMEYNSVDIMVDELKILNFPKLFGGSSNCSAYRYVMMESIARNRYKNMMTVKGTFKMCLSEKDTNLSLIADIYISNFIEGGRLVSNSSVPQMTDSDRLRSNQIRTQLNKPNEYRYLIHDSSNVDRSPLPLSVHRSCTRIDITKLLNEVSRPKLFPERASRCQMFQELRQFENQVSKGRKNGIFIMDTNSIYFPEATVYPKVLIARGIKYETFNRSKDISHSVISIEKRIVSGEQRWEKYVTFIDNSLDEESIIKSLSKDGDKVVPIRLYENKLVHVSIRDFNGHYFVCLTNSQDLSVRLPMLYLCTSSPIANKTLILHPTKIDGTISERFFGTKSEMQALGMYDVITKDQEVEEFYKREEPEEESKKSEIEDNDLAIIDGVEMDNYSFGDDSDEELSGSDEEVASGFHSVRSSASYVHNFTSDTSLRYSKDRLGRPVWLLKVPVTMDRMEFYPEPEDNKTALEALIDYLDNGDASDSMWVRYCLKTSFLRSKDVQNLLKYL